MTLDQYLKSVCAVTDRADFVSKTGSSLQYLRHVAAGRKKPSVEMCIAIERASDVKVRCETLRPDVDWVYLQSRKS